MAEYIEREKLLERIDGIWDCADLVFEPNDHCCRADDCASCKWAETKNAIRKIIAYFPAAAVRPVVTCAECKWWTKQEASLQGRCELLQMYPTGAWFCANGKREES